MDAAIGDEKQFVDFLDVAVEENRENQMNKVKNVGEERTILWTRLYIS